MSKSFYFPQDILAQVSKVDSLKRDLLFAQNKYNNSTEVALIKIKLKRAENMLKKMMK